MIYASTISKNQHALKFGTDAMYSNYSSYGYTGPSSGTYNFRSLADFQQGRYTNYSQSFGEPLLRTPHTYVSAFVQDSWVVGSRLTLNYGLRYDVEMMSTYKGVSFGRDRNNFGPRFALSYDLTGKGKTLAKVSSGIYYDHLSQINVTSTYRGLRDDPQQVSVVWLLGQPGAPVYPNTFGSIAVPADAPRNLRNVFIIPDEMQIPASAQLVVTLDHAVAADFAVSASLLYSRSWNKEIPLDRNLLFNNTTQAWTRPDPGFRSITQYTFSGRAEYTALALQATKRLKSKLSFDASLTVARSLDMNDNFNIAPNDHRFIDDEWGPSPDVPTVRFVTNASYTINRLMQVSGIYRGRGGYAFDPRSGNTFDLNGDGQFNDRTPGFGRNSFRGPATHSVDARFTSTVPFKQQRLQFMVEAFNLLNRENIQTVNTIYGPAQNAPLPRFLTPQNYLPPREVQLGVQWRF